MSIDRVGMKIQNGKKLLFIGDSITDGDRDRQTACTKENRLGKGYVALVNAMLEASWPERTITVRNAGISGNQVTDLEARWASDVLELKPDWLTIMIGINDVWRQFATPPYESLVKKPQFESVLTRLVEQMLPKLNGLVLMTPFLIEPRKDDPMRVMMDDYGVVVKSIAARAGAVFVDTQAAFDRFLMHRAHHEICEDRIHPNLTGHTILARAFMDQICD